MREILVVDDDIHIGNMLREALGGRGYGVARAYSGTEARLILSGHRPDLILLDLMLPGLSGEELLPLIKDTPVIVISAKAEAAHKRELLLGGAADYVTKPFDLSELLARVRVQFRKSGDREADKLTFEELTLDPEALTVTAGDKQARLTRTESAILKLLMQSPGCRVSKSAILRCISRDTPDCTERSLKQHISNIRKKLTDLNGKSYIEAIYGIGYGLKG